MFGDERLLEHCVYTLANPCRAHLVVRSRHWEGVSSLKLATHESSRVVGAHSTNAGGSPMRMISRCGSSTPVDSR